MCHKGDVSILIRMEQAVLNILNFQLHVADPIFFLNRLMLYDENGRSEEVTSSTIFHWITWSNSISFMIPFLMLIIEICYFFSFLISARTAWILCFTMFQRWRLLPLKWHLPVYWLPDSSIAEWSFHIWNHSRLFIFIR